MHQADASRVSLPVELKVFSSRVAGYLLFWLLFFQLQRAAFLLYHLPLSKELDPGTNAGVFCYGLIIDAATASYLLIIPYLLWFIQLFRRFKWVPALVRAYTAGMVTLVSLLSAADLQVYREWGVKLNATALAYLKHPREAAASMASSPLLLLVAICVGSCLVGHFGYQRLAVRGTVASAGNGLPAVAARFCYFLLGTGLLVICLRGGVGQAPMNPSFAYFSTQQFANHAALNTSWNLLYDLKHSRGDRESGFSYLPQAEMQARLERLNPTGDKDVESILTEPRPNIVCIILESWTADVVRSLGGAPGLTPNLEKLISRGLLFTDIYSSGSRTSYGIPSVLSGFPSTPDGSVLENPVKVEKLPSLNADLRRQGYQASFYYGGDARFDNMNAFFRHGGVERIVDRSSFAGKDMDSKWGAHDHALYDRVLADISGSKEPFLVSLLTLSSHEPYEVPMPRVVPGSDEASLFKNAMVYADRCLGEFLEKASRQSWYKKTLFVLVADHGHRLPQGHAGYAPEKYHIPLLFFGEVLKPQYRGVKRGGVGSQTDIAATLLSQLKLPHEAYPFSNNLLNRKRSCYAFYNFKDGFGWRCEDGGTIAFDNVAKKVILDTRSGPAGQRGQMLKDGQAYMQHLAQRYSGL